MMALGRLIIKIRLREPHWIVHRSNPDIVNKCRTGSNIEAGLGDRRSLRDATNEVVSLENRRQASN